MAGTKKGSPSKKGAAAKASGSHNQISIGIRKEFVNSKKFYIDMPSTIKAVAAPQPGLILSYSKAYHPFVVKNSDGSLATLPSQVTMHRKVTVYAAGGSEPIAPPVEIGTKKDNRNVFWFAEILAHAGKRLEIELWCPKAPEVRPQTYEVSITGGGKEKHAKSSGSELPTTKKEKDGFLSLLPRYSVFAACEPLSVRGPSFKLKLSRDLTKVYTSNQS